MVQAFEPKHEREQKKATPKRTKQILIPMIPIKEAPGNSMNNGIPHKTTLREALSITFSLEIFEDNHPKKGKAQKSITSKNVFNLIICVFVNEDTKGINPFIKTSAIE